MPELAQIEITCYPAQTVADRLISHSFSETELLILSRNVIFKNALDQMKTIDDAFNLAALGATLVTEMVKGGEWKESQTQYLLPPLVMPRRIIIVRELIEPSTSSKKCSPKFLGFKPEFEVQKAAPLETAHHSLGIKKE